LRSKVEHIGLPNHVIFQIRALDCGVNETAAEMRKEAGKETPMRARFLTQTPWKKMNIDGFVEIV